MSRAARRNKEVGWGLGLGEGAEEALTPTVLDGITIGEGEIAEAQVACAARKAELDAQLAAATKAEESERCSVLRGEVRAAAAELVALADARAREWEEVARGEGGGRGRGEGKK